MWYDGRGSRGRAARLDSPAPGTLRVESEGEVLEFATAELRISPRLGRMERIVTLPRLGQLNLADSPRLDEWFGGRDRIEGWAHRLEKLRGAAIAAALVTVVGVVVFVQVGLPWMAEKVAPLVPRAMERTIGGQAMDLLDAVHLAPSRLPRARRTELDLRFREMVAGLPREHDYQLAFRDAPSLGPNAFALPDGRLVVTDQLVALAAGDDELLAVLAHEAGHHEHRHGMRQALQSSAVVVVAGFLFGDLSGTASLSVSVPVLLLESGFSRAHEREADAFAFDLLRRTGRSPADFATIMARLADHHGDAGEGPVSYLSTHPPSDARIRAAREAARPAPEGNRPND